MFGSSDDDPAIRAAREAQHDRALADAEFRARTGYAPEDAGRGYATDYFTGQIANLPQSRWWETPQSIAAEVDARRNTDVLNQRGKRAEDVINLGPGSTLLQRDALTGSYGPVFQSPMRPEKEVTYEVPVQVDVFGKTSQTIPMTAQQIRAAVEAKSLPDIALKSPVVGWIRSQPGGSTAQPPASFRGEGYIGESDRSGNFFNSSLRFGRDPFSEGFEIGRSSSATNSPSTVRIRSVRQK